MCHKFGHFTSVCYQKNQQTLGSSIHRKPKAHQLQAGMKVQKTQLTNLQLPKPVYLMTNLAYHLKMHHRRNQYLHARLDKCRCQSHASYCMSVDVQRHQLKEAYPIYSGDRNIHK